jgi:hypothetical protein
MSDSSLNPAYFACYITLNDTGIMTLNGLQNAYNSPPCDSRSSPPLVTSVIKGNTGSVLAYQCSGGEYRQSISPYGTPVVTAHGFSNTFSYNLPDGSLLKVSFDISTKRNTYYSAEGDWSPQLSEDSLYEVLGYTRTDDGAGNFSISFEVKLAS